MPIKIEMPNKKVVDKRRFKRCKIQLNPLDGVIQSFGFTLNSRVKPKYMILDLDQESPAYKANLRTNDVIIAIDGQNIRRLGIEKVKVMMSEAMKRRKIEILAISVEGYLAYKEKKSLFDFTFDWDKLTTVDKIDLYTT